jgi:hypothetical protein
MTQPTGGFGLVLLGPNADNAIARRIAPSSMTLALMP